MRIKSGLICAAAFLAFNCAGQSVIVSSGNVAIRGNSYGDVLQTALASVNGGTGADSYKFKVDSVTHYAGGNSGIIENLLVVTPLSGVTPARVAIGPNPNVTKALRPGRYFVSIIFMTVDQTPPSYATTRVSMDLESPPLPKIESVVNAASVSGPIAPGMVVTITGSSLGPPVLASSYDTAGMYPFEWGHTNSPWLKSGARAKTIEGGNVPR